MKNNDQNMKIGDWVVGRMPDSETYPGKVAFVIGETVVFEMIDELGGKIEIHRRIAQVRPATALDFDRQIMDINKNIIDMEMTIQRLYEAQREVL
jgi:hypothetical protein